MFLGIEKLYLYAKPYDFMSYYKKGIMKRLLLISAAT
jgi:hypothetical protein